MTRTAHAPTKRSVLLSQTVYTADSSVAANPADLRHFPDQWRVLALGTPANGSAAAIIHTDARVVAVTVVYVVVVVVVATPLHP